ncbi:MAG: hypothetical protein HYV08_00165 [Deltaproteobacteria bacterium]|nr:hypothetical protein [Deltaproteobacteria bacterium]MBI3077047.1 hypothetical protein [Deltaproteobacteria bacterium]
MTPPPIGRVRLVDGEDGRTTAALVASLAARLASLHFISGATAVGSLVAGFAGLGREVSRTAEGARLRWAIEAGRGGANGEALWTALRIGEWASGLPASPILDELRNDLALLLADDLEETLNLLPIPGEPAGARAAPEETVPATFVDCVLGLWAFSMELIRAVEALAAPTLLPQGAVMRDAERGREREGPLLR